MIETEKRKRVCVVTLGCEKNTVDSEVLMGGLRGSNAVLASRAEDAEIVIVNTCGFIDSAKQESIGAILEAVNLKKRGVVKEVYVAGCLSERYRAELAAEIPEADGFFGTQDFEKIISTIVPRTSDSPDLKYDLLGERVLTTPKHFAYVKISEGCDNPCSFCAIPIMRGGHRSRDIEEIAFEAMMLANAGVKEIILIAQDLTYYGLDQHGSRTLSDLLRRLVKISGLEWIRLMYAYPAKFPLDILEVIAGEEKIVKYLDIPVQHASTEVLKSMRRGITRRATEELIETIRAKVPGIALRTTVITGYPAEGEAEFRELEEFIEQMCFDRLGVFTYSVEDGTTAEPLADPVLHDEKLIRQRRLIELQRGISFAKNELKIGKTLRVLLDRREDGYVIGRTEADAPEVDAEIRIEAEANSEILVGSFANVLVTAAEDYDLIGRVA